MVNAYSIESELCGRLVEFDQRLRAIHGGPAHQDAVLDPVSMLIFAILSQRTRHPEALQAYENLQLEFDNWGVACDSPSARIERAICMTTWPEQKAPRLKLALQSIRYLRRGQIDLNNLLAMSDSDASAWLERIPGVRRKTGACVLLFSTLRRPVLPVDTGHRRVKIRLGLMSKSLSWDSAHSALQAQLPRDWDADEIENHHNAVKRHAQRYCLAKEPACSDCPLQDMCPYGRARLSGRLCEAPTIARRRSTATQEHPWQMCMHFD